MNRNFPSFVWLTIVIWLWCSCVYMVIYVPCGCGHRLPIPLLADGHLPLAIVKDLLWMLLMSLPSCFGSADPHSNSVLYFLRSCVMSDGRCVIMHSHPPLTDFQFLLWIDFSHFFSCPEIFLVVDVGSWVFTSSIVRLQQGLRNCFSWKAAAVGLSPADATDAWWKIHGTWRLASLPLFLFTPFTLGLIPIRISIYNY